MLLEVLPLVVWLPHPPPPQSPRLTENWSDLASQGSTELALSCLAEGKPQMGIACYLFAIQYYK